jgi:hypothetical protein
MTVTSGKPSNHPYTISSVRLQHTDSGSSATTLHKDSSDSSAFSTEHLVEAWFNEVKPFGTVSIQNVPFDVIIQPLNPLDNTEANKGIVKLYYSGDSAGLSEGSDSNTADARYRFNVWKYCFKINTCTHFICPTS